MIYCRMMFATNKCSLILHALSQTKATDIISCSLTVPCPILIFYQECCLMNWKKTNCLIFHITWLHCNVVALKKEPGHPSVGRCNEYWRWFRPPLVVCSATSLTKTAGIAQVG